MTDEPLPGMPAAPPKRQDLSRPGVRVSRIRNRKLCEQCCRLIHTLGPAVAPYPRSARWRITFDDFSVNTCDDHRDWWLQ